MSRRALTAAFLVAGCAHARVETEAHALVGTAPRAREEQDLESRVVTIPTPGKVTVVDVWQTSCAPCVKEMPELEAMSRDYAAAGLVVVGVAADDNPGLVLSKLAERGVTYPNIVDVGGGLRGSLLADRLPEAVVFDRHGRVRAVRVGGDPDDLPALRSTVKALLDEP